MMSQIYVWPACGCSFLIFHTGWYGVCEIEFSHMGRISGNPDLVCKNKYYLVSCRWVYQPYKGYQRLGSFVHFIVPGCDHFRSLYIEINPVCIKIYGPHRENLSSGFPKKRVSYQSPQLQRLTRKLKFHL